MRKLAVMILANLAGCPEGRAALMDGGGRWRVGWRGCFGAHGERMGKREVERKGEPRSQGTLVSNARKFTNLAPVSNFYYITTILVYWG